MNYLEPSNQIILVTSDYLCVIKIAGYTGNLALTTIVYVNTQDNTAQVHYKVQSWNDKHKRITKKFINYSDAHAYYIKINNKFGKH